jgi:Ran GTPase-activating protein (RanGAP) involved in mRNA processing and transport
MDNGWRRVLQAPNLFSCAHLAAVLQSEHCKVTTLNLGGLLSNNIDAEGCTHLATALQSKHCKVTTLDLSHNFIGDEGCAHLATALESAHCTVTTLKLHKKKHFRVQCVCGMAATFVGAPSAHQAR